MNGAIVILVVVFGSAAVLGLVALLRLASDLKKSVQAMEKQVTRLELTTQSQAAEINALRQKLEARNPDPLYDVIGILGAARQKGLWPTLAVVGAKVFQSYWRNGRAKALPAPPPTEVQK